MLISIEISDKYLRELFHECGVRMLVGQFMPEILIQDKICLAIMKSAKDQGFNNDGKA